MIPLRDENPTAHVSIATFAIIIVNVLVWVFVQKFGTNPGLMRSILRFGLIPAELLQTVEPGTKVKLGSEYFYKVSYGLEWPTVATSMFLHGGWLHIIGNMWFLFVFGDNVEDAMGSFRFVIFYLLCGIAAAAAQLVSGPSSVLPMVGASGAIGGVMGAYALLYPGVRVQVLVILGFFFTRIRVPAFLMLGYWLVLQVVSGLTETETGIAVWAHAGGFAAGFVLVRFFCKKERLEEAKQARAAKYG